MSMDPDGTNRIIKQQVREWYSEIDEARKATLVQSEPGRSLGSGIASIARHVTLIGMRIATFRRRPLVSPVAVSPVAVSPVAVSPVAVSPVVLSPVVLSPAAKHTPTG